MRFSALDLHRMKHIALTISLWTLSLLVSLRTGIAQERIALFDGRTLDGWTTLDGQPVTQGWEAVDGTLHLSTSGERAGHIVTAQEYGDFDLEFEWKIAPKGNSGVKYRVREFGNRVLGCEFQILDDAGYHQQLRPKGLTGSLYDLYEPNAAKRMRPLDEFNHSRIVVRGDRIQHWLNGHLIVLAHVGNPEWNRRIADSKFAEVDGFGRNGVGRIMLTDHRSEVWYRNIHLTPLPPPERSTVAWRCGTGRACRCSLSHRRRILFPRIQARIRHRLRCACKYRPLRGQ